MSLTILSIHLPLEERGYRNLVLRLVSHERHRSGKCILQIVVLDTSLVWQVVLYIHNFS